MTEQVANRNTGQDIGHSIQKAMHAAEEKLHHGLSPEMVAKFKAMEPHLDKIMSGVKEKLALHNVPEHHNPQHNAGHHQPNTPSIGTLRL